MPPDRTDGFSDYLYDELVKMLIKLPGVSTVLENYVADKSEKTLFENVELLDQLLSRFTSENGDFSSVEVLTSMVIFWHNNHQNLNSEIRSKFINLLLNSYSHGNYDLLILAEILKEENKKNPEQRSGTMELMRPIAKNWLLTDRSNMFNIKEIFATTENPEDAEKILLTSFPYRENDQSPECGWYIYEMGFNFYEGNALEKAEEYVNKAHKILPEEPKIINCLGLICFKHENYDDAFHYFHKAQEKNKDTEEVTYIGNMGDALKNEKKYKEAIEKYLECIKRKSGKKSYQENLAFCYNEVGLEFYHKKNFGEALKYFEMAHYYNEEQQVYVQNIASAFNEIGRDYITTLQYEKAFENFQLAITNKDYAMYFSNAGLAKRYLKKYDEAIRYYEKAIKKESDGESNKENLALFNNYLGLVYSDQMKDDLALKYYKKAAELDPSKAIFQANIGFSYKYLNEADNAIESYKKASLLENDSKTKAGYFYTIGTLYSFLSKYEDASVYYQKATELDPDNPTYKDTTGKKLEKI